MRTPRIKAGVNNENNTSKCPHKPRTNPLMLICRPGVPSLLPTAFCSGGNGPTQNARYLTGNASRRFAAPRPGAAAALGEKNSPDLTGTNAAISAPLGHVGRSIAPSQVAPETRTAGPCGGGHRALGILESCVSLAESLN